MHNNKMLITMLQGLSISNLLRYDVSGAKSNNAPFPRASAGASSSYTKNIRYYANKKIKNRRRNKIARKSRRINRMVAR